MKKSPKPLLKSLIFLSLSLALLSNCAPRQALTLHTPIQDLAHSPINFDQQKKLQSLQGYAQISLAHPKGVQHLEGAFWLQAPDKLKFLFLDELGQNQAELSIQGPWIWIQNHAQGSEQIIHSQDGSLKKALHLPLNSQRLLQALLLHQPQDPKIVQYGPLKKQKGLHVPTTVLFSFKKTQVRLRLKEIDINPKINPTKFWIPHQKSE